jgi:hypothetical protein
MANDESISSNMVLSQAARVRKLVENGDYDKCPVKGEQDVQLFLIDGMTAILKQARQGNFYAILSGGTTGAIIFGIIEALKAFGPHVAKATGN